MKKFFITAIDNLDRPIACATFDTKKECESWYYGNYDKGGCTYKIRQSDKIIAQSAQGQGNLPTGFENDEFTRLS